MYTNDVTVINKDMKRDYKAVEIEYFEDRLDSMLESDWTLGKCLVVSVTALIVVVGCVAIGNIIIGLN